MKTESYQYLSELVLREYTIAEPIFWFTSVIAGILMCKIFYNATKILTPLYFKGYHKLTKAEQIEWNNRGFSTAHAVLVSVVSIYLLFVSDIFRDNVQDGPVTLRNSPFSTFILGVSIGYFLSDLVMILWLYPSLGGKEYVLHHLLSMCSIALSMFSGQGQLYIYMVLLSESTTPGVNLRWYLDTAGLKKSKAYVINGVAMFFGWLVKQILPVGFYSLFMAPPLLAMMNIFWFWRITKGLKKTLSKRA